MIRYLRALGRILLLVLAAPFLAVAYLFRPRVPRKTILELDLEQGVVEIIPDDPLGALAARRMVVIRDVVEALERAAADERVLALVARIGGGPLGMAQVEEIRDSVLAFRRSGKPAIAFSESFGEGAPGHAGYYLATAFDEVYLQPSGDVGLTGLTLEAPFIRRALDKLGVEPRLDHRHEYKNAMNLFTEEAFTEPHRESLAAVAESLLERILEGVAAGRSMPIDEARLVIDRGPFFGNEALEAGLVDGLEYRDEVYRRVRDRFPGARLLYHHVYLRRAGRSGRRGPTVALIHGVGPVRRGESASTLLAGAFGTTMGARTVADAFRAAIDDESVKAILFRVDSPGGSYAASDTIWRETIRARDAGKPVIVTMGNVAASGGYFVAMDAARIVAHPSTLTGSIGVLGGKAVTRGLWERLGVTWDEVHAGRRSTMWSLVQDYTPEDWNRIQTWLDRIYDDFTGRVVEARGLSAEDVDAAARGRVWTGTDAARLGLVDELGGYGAALRLVRDELGVEPGAPVRLKPFPERKSLLRRLRRDRPRSSDELGAAVLDHLRPILQEAPYQAMPGGLGELEMPQIRIR